MMTMTKSMMTRRRRQNTRISNEEAEHCNFAKGKIPGTPQEEVEHWNSATGSGALEFRNFSKFASET